MRKINFLIPYSRKPYGGIRVIHHICQMLSDKMDVGINMIGQDRNKASPNTFERKVSRSEESHWILPEFLLPYVKKPRKIRKCYSVFVQNPYIIFKLKRHDKKGILDSLENAANIFCISKDCESMIKLLAPSVKTLRLKWAVDREVQKSAEDLASYFGQKKNLITYMPRKCKELTTYLALISERWTEWEIRPIENLSFIEVINSLKESKIFLSFSEFEGFAAPPVEASVLGNIVIGFSGNGNNELFEQKNFLKVEQNNLLDLIQLTQKKTQNYNFDLDVAKKLLDKFSFEEVRRFNLDSFRNASLEEMTSIKSNISYPSSYVGFLVDAMRTKFHELY